MLAFLRPFGVLEEAGDSCIDSADSRSVFLDLRCRGVSGTSGGGIEAASSS